MKYKKTIFAVSISVFIAGAWTFFNIFEPVSSANIAVNFSKRVAAEAGNLVTKIYDPYEKKSKPGLINLAANFEDFKSAVGKDDYLSRHLSISRYENGPTIKSSFEFDYQPYDEKKLQILREKYKLDEMIKPAKNEFEKMILIREWLNSYMKFGVPHDINYNFNALDILERAGKGDTFFCSEYATTYIELLASIGITGRYAGLFKGHAVSEIWSDDYAKWVIMDPTYNIYYEDKGMPLNALELHNAWFDNRWKDIKVMFGNKNREIERYPYKLIDYYADFFVRMRNDWLTNQYPRWHTKSNSIMNSLEWSDAYTRNDIRVAEETKKQEDLYWKLNQVYIKLISYKILQDKLVLTLYLDTITPNFSEFLIKSDQRSDATRTVEPVFDWQLGPGLNTLEVSPFNKFGIKGKAAVISVNYM